MKINFYTFILFFFASLQFSNAQSERFNISLIDSIDYAPTLNDIWGYATPNGREYALVGMTSGVSIVEVTQPLEGGELEELFFIPGDTSTWRDVKTFRNYAYIVNEKGGGMQIVNLAGLPDTSQITVQNWTGGTWADSTLVCTQAHNLFIDEKGIGYIVGADFSKGGAIMIDIAANSTNPPIIGVYDDFYIHDIYVRGDTMWTAEIYTGEFAVVDVKDKLNPVTLARHSTPSNFTHNTWLSDDGKTLFTTDERNNAFVAAYDVSDLTDIREVDRYQTATSLNQGVVPHNTFVKGNHLVTSYYTDGVTIVDATFPNNLIEVGYYDTSTNEGGGFSGCWGVYPYLPSGLILASDRQNGLYVLESDYLRACYLSGSVVDAVTNEAITDVAITVGNYEAASTKTDFSGNFETGVGAAGLYEVTFVKYGYPITTISDVGMSNGEITELNVELAAIEGFKVNIQAVDALTGEAIPNAQVRVEHPLKEIAMESEESGIAVFDLVYAAEYQIIVGKWGYETAAFTDIYVDENTGTLTLQLVKGFYDDFTFDFGWTVESDASKGIWERGKSNRSLFGGQYITPDGDLPDDIGGFCYITGNGVSFSDNVNDGFTTLQSPIFDATIFENPELNYHRWYYLQNSNFFASDDTLYISLSNGIDTVNLETLVNNDAAEAKWAEQRFLVRELLTPTDEMQLIFEVSDTGTGHLVEAALDLFRLHEGPPVPSPAFAATVVQGCSPLVVSFNSTTEGNVESVQWKFQGGDVFITNNPTPTVTYTEAGSYDVTLKVTTDGGTEERTFINYITVLEGTTPELNLTASELIACQGETVTLTATSNQSVTYNWTDAAANVGDTESINITAESTATYGVVIMNEQGCTANQQLEIEVPMPTLAVNFPDEAICNGSLVQFSIVNPKEDYTYFWNGSEVSVEEGVMALATVSVDAPNYEVTAVEPNGCGVSEIIELEVLVSTAAFTSQVGEICVGEKVTFFDLSENADSYLWEFENTNTGNVLISQLSNPVITFEEAGMYNVSQHIEGCNASMEQKEAFLTVRALPVVAIDAPNVQVCIESGTGLTAVVNNPTGLTFEWSGTGISDATQQTTSAMPETEGWYEYTVIVTDDLGCSNQATNTIDFAICGSINPELAALYSLQIVPNPNEGLFVVSMDLSKIGAVNEGISLQLVNVLGQTVEQFFVGSSAVVFEQKVDLRGLASGVYYLVIEVDGERVLEKVVVE
ncbi:MAG: choice-of-anchor B family protein [Chitinophagales bacterium]